MSPQHAVALLIALIFFLGCIVVGCLWAMLILHMRRVRALQSTPRWQPPLGAPGQGDRFIRRHLQLRR